jgi:hypothetical protein
MRILHCREHPSFPFALRYALSSPAFQRGQGTGAAAGMFAPPTVDWEGFRIPRRSPCEVGISWLAQLTRTFAMNLHHVRFGHAEGSGQRFGWGCDPLLECPPHRPRSSGVRSRDRGATTPTAGSVLIAPRPFPAIRRNGSDARTYPPQLLGTPPFNTAKARCSSISPRNTIHPAPRIVTNPRGYDRTWQVRDFLSVAAGPHDEYRDP